MIENATTAEARTAFQVAHEERAKAMKAAWAWLFRSRHMA